MPQALGLHKRIHAVHGVRSLTKAVFLVLNDQTPTLAVDPETYEVRVDGELVTCEPAHELALAQRCFLF
ncbi:MAG: hypothetical protein R2742_07615 [Micropruina glycogenica]